jgi:hypothetical protein
MKILFALLLAGCGGAADPVQHFLGTWSFSDGTNNVVCPTGTTAEKLTGNITIQRATSGGGLVVIDAESCDFPYTLSGDAADTTQQSCSFAVPQLGAGVTADVTYDRITLTTSDGKSMSDVFNGTVVYHASSGDLDCSFSGSATLSKISSQ